MTDALPRRVGLLTNFTEDGNTGWLKLGEAQHKLAAKLCIFSEGTWGGGTLTVQIAADPDGDTAVEEGTDVTADGSVIELTGYSPNVYFRVTLGSSTSPDLNVYAV